MNWQEFEAHMKAGIPSHESEVDTEQLWKAIQSKKRRRRPLVWWMLGAMIPLLIGLWQLLGRPNSHPAEVSQSAVRPAASVRQGQQAPAGAAPQLRASESLSPSTAMVASHAPLPSIPANAAPAAVGRPTFKGQQPTSNALPDPLHTTPHAPEAAPELLVAPLPTQEMDPILRTLPERRPVALLPVPIRPLPARPLPAGRPAAAPTEQTPAIATPPKAMVFALTAASGAWMQRSSKDLRGEKPLEFVEISAYGNWALHQRWRISAGVGYTRYHSVFRWQNQWTEDSVLAPVTHLNGDQDSIYTISPVNYQRTVRHYNRVSTLRIPLECSYQWTWNRYAIAPFAGLQIDFFQKATGKREAENGFPDASLHTRYDRRVALGARCGVTGIIPLRNDWQCTVSPFFSTDLRPRTGDSREYFSQWGLQVGIGKKIGMK